jgi:uridine-cytidine kinase C
VHSQILRRLFRDVDRTGEKPRNILKYFLDVVWKMHKKYIEPTKQNADLILLNDYLPQLEAKNAKIKSERVKYKVSIPNLKEKI